MNEAKKEKCIINKNLKWVDVFVKKVDSSLKKISNIYTLLKKKVFIIFKNFFNK